MAPGRDVYFDIYCRIEKAVSAVVNSQLLGVLTLLFGEGVSSSLSLSSLAFKKGIFYLSKTWPFPVSSWENEDYIL